LVSPKSPDELLGGLLALLRERDLAAELGARARAYVLEHHDLRGLAARLALVYRHLAQRQPLASTLVSVDTVIDGQDRGAAG
jgi:hypothetical protein